MHEVEAWANETFPDSNDHAQLAHLRKEVEELCADPDSGEELADVLFMLSHLIGPLGVSVLVGAIFGRLVVSRIAQDVAAKLEVNRKRDWDKPDADGVVSHLKGDDRHAL